jgi:CHRD domain
MSTIRTVLAVLAVAGLLLAACGGSDGGAATPPTTSTRNVVFNVNLDGLAEVPGPGAIDGTGNADIIVDPLGTEVCYTLRVDNIDPVTSVHIHEGRNGVAGPIVVTLKTPVPDPTKCVTTTRSIVKGLTSGDRAFYIEVHTAAFPDGAIRAQLKG